jgi:hypothetical protein
MGQIILMRGSAATASADDAEALVRALPGGRVLHRGSEHLLVDVGDEHVEPLKVQLAGWTVSPQRERIPVPDTRRTIRK